MAEYDEDGGCHRVEYDDGDNMMENLHGSAQAQWQGKVLEAVPWRKQGQPAARKPQAESESQSEAESEQEAEVEPKPKPKRPANPANLPSEPSQRRQRGSTSEPHAAAQSAFGAGSRGQLRYSADLVRHLPLLVRRPACPPLLCNSTLQSLLLCPCVAQVRQEACELLGGCWVDGHGARLDGDVARLLGMRGTASIPVRRCCRFCTATGGQFSVLSSPRLASQVYSKYETTDRPKDPAAVRNAGGASASGLQLRVAMLWFGQKVVAAAVHRHSHEEYPPSHTTAPPSREKRSGKPPQSEILLFGVSDGGRRKGLGTALFQYVKHLAIVHGSQNLLVLYSKSSLGAAAFWSLKLQGHWPAASGDDNQAARQEPKLLYVSLFNDPSLTLCRLVLNTESKADSLQVLKQATETAERKLQTNVTKATGPPDQLQQGACHPAQPGPISLPSLTPSPFGYRRAAGLFFCKRQEILLRRAP